MSIARRTTPMPTDGLRSRCPGLNRGPTVYEIVSGGYVDTNSHDVSTDLQAARVEPHASSHILEHKADRIALGLLEAQAGWISTHDRVKLRRALLGLVASLDDE
jgi:hypothetical protein